MIKTAKYFIKFARPCLKMTQDGAVTQYMVYSFYLFLICHETLLWFKGEYLLQKDSIVYALWQQDDDSSSTNVSHGHLHISPCSPLGKRRAIQERERDKIKAFHLLVYPEELTKICTTFSSLCRQHQPSSKKSLWRALDYYTEPIYAVVFRRAQKGLLQNPPVHGLGWEYLC